MCGIAGVIGPLAPSEVLVREMTRAIAHRGPDDEGLWIDPAAQVALGNRRLAIVDLSPAGHQPMQSADRRFVLTFNGEIYNHAEIRNEIEARGEEPEGGWRGHCDTETFLQAIAAWGLERALDRSIGMFAFALWDRKHRSLRLARDRFGEKPLYYGWVGKDFLFASELKAIRTHPAFDAPIDRQALRLFVSRGYIPAPLTIYRGIFKLEPGCILNLDAGAEKSPRNQPVRPGESTPGLSCIRYWSYRDVLRAGLSDPIADEQEAIGILEPAIAQAVRQQSLADVPVGAFLSGGIDSSTIVALHRKYSGGRVETFTIGFEERAYSEAADARAVADFFGTRHHERIVTDREAREVIPRLPAIYDEPFADSSQIPTFLVSAFASERVKVALSGDGGDELFGGYNRYIGTARLWSAAKHLPRPLRAAANALLGQVPPPLWNGAAALATGRRLPPQVGFKVRKSLRTIARARRLDDLLAALLDEWDEEGTPVIGAERSDIGVAELDLGIAAPDPLRMMHSDAVGYLPDDVLCKVDRASMAVGLEVHVPFLDHRVAEAAARVVPGLKVRGGTGKHILRQLLYREAPSRLFDRPKAGFQVPVGEWIRGPLRDWAEALLDQRTIAGQGLLDPAAIVSRWQDHISGRHDSTAALWAVLMFQAWLETRNAPAVTESRAPKNIVIA